MAHHPTRRSVLKWSAVTAAAAWLAPALPAALASAATGTIPPLDSLTSDWLPKANVRRLPAVSNFWGAVNVTANVAGFANFTLAPYVQAGSCGTLTVDGSALNTATFRWSAYEIRRKATTQTGLTVQTATRLAFESNQLLMRIAVTNPTSATVSTTLSMSLSPRIRKATTGWSWSAPRPSGTNFTARTVGSPVANVMVSDGSSAAVTAFAANSGVVFTASGAAGTASWNLRIAPGATRTVNVVMAVSDTSTGKPLAAVAEGQHVVDTANASLRSFASVFGKAGHAWSKRWAQAFTAGNTHYSGCLPVLTPENSPTGNAIARLYYMSILSVLACERTNLGPSFNALLGRNGSFSGYDRVYVTGAPEYSNTVTYFWDTSYASVMLALLDPAVMRAQTTDWLGRNIYGCYAVDQVQGNGVGPWYSANDLTVFTTVDNYVNYSGDTDFLQTTVGSATVLQHLTDNATHWKSLVPAGQQLADYGANHNLLEVLPKYTNQVASFNAANVWMMYRAATHQQNAGNASTAKSLIASANTLLQNVLALYVAGQGVWNCRHADGTLVPVRTVLDFAIGGNLIADKLTAQQQAEMKNFVTNELLVADWMRALSLSDSQAPVPRPDHGTIGAYASWPALTAQTFARFSDYPSFLSQLTAFAGVTTQGPISQAAELLHLSVALDDRPALNPTSALTVSAWVNATSWPTQIFEGSIIAKDTWASGNAGYVLRGGAGGQISFALVIDDRWVELKTTSTVPTGGWHHVAAVYDGATVKIYIDGALQATRTQTGALTPSTGTPAVVGSSPADSSRDFLGSIDEARVYNRALTASDIAAAAAATDPTVGVTSGGTPDPGLVLRFAFDEGTGTTTREGVTGTTVPTNGATWASSRPGFGKALTFPASSATAVSAGDVMTFNLVGAGKFADVIISDLFGFAPDGTNPKLRDAADARGFRGTLSGLVFKGTSYTITSSAKTGLVIAGGQDRGNDQ
ncbi:LamG domain-containing protein [Streptomyces sp. NPDC057565]|uniref:LamG domain-containing protein n=1 Tax=Streptomyces sp. NPDC057565 TaxID=3346169 RepID=UPI003697F761